jgi:phage terminase large subunit
MPEVSIPDKLTPFAEITKRFKIAIGGRGSAKSVTAADLLLGRIDMEGIKVGCGREFQNSIDDSVHSLMAAEIDRIGASGFKVNATNIAHVNGGGVIYKGLARNVESIKSMKGIDVFWVEEAQTLSQKSIEILTPTIRESGSEIWFTGNPRFSNDPFSKRFIKPYEKELKKNGYYEDDMHLIIFVNYIDNPWFPPELEQERVFDLEHKPRAKYNHIWLGDYDDTIEDAIIAPDWFDACVDAHKKLGWKPRGIEVVSHDPSDNGNDAKGLAYRHGNVFLDVQEREFGDINDGADWALDYAQDKKPDLFIWDGDGMGAGIRRQVNESLGPKNIRIAEFRGGGEVDNPKAKYVEVDSEETKAKTNSETFKNKRAQYYWNLRDRCYKTYLAVVKGKYIDPDELISFSSDIDGLDLLRSEICSVPLKHNGMGLIQIMSKQDMKKLDIASPNMADSVMMCLADPPAKKKLEPINIPSMGIR